MDNCVFNNYLILFGSAINQIECPYHKNDIYPLSQIILSNYETSYLIPQCVSLSVCTTLEDKR
jgi:hypothetical protein